MFTWTKSDYFVNCSNYHRTLHHQVDIFRSKDLKTMETSIKVGFGDLVISGVYNSTGHMGTVWLQVPVTVPMSNSHHMMSSCFRCRWTVKETRTSM